MRSWLHRKLYKHAMISDFHAMCGVNIVRLSEECVGPTTTQILIEQAYKEHPRNPGLGAIYIARFLAAEGYAVEAVLDAADQSSNRMRPTQSCATLGSKSEANHSESNSIGRDHYRKDSVKKNEKVAIEASVNSDFEKASRFFPDLQTKLVGLAPFGSEIQSRFMQEILEKKQFDNPEQIVNSIIDRYAAARFGPDKIVQNFGCSLIIKKKYKLADELESYVKVVGDAVPSETIIFHISHKVQREAHLKKIATLYRVENNQKSYFVAVLKDGSCIGESGSTYTKVKDIISFRNNAKDFGATYTQVNLHDEAMEFIAKVPDHLFG